MYEVGWANEAFHDLQDKVRTDIVRRYLLAVSRSALHRHHDVRWGGRLDEECWWRRGVTLKDEADPDMIRGGTAAGRPEMPYDYVLVYLRSVRSQIPKALVLYVVTNQELAAALAGAPFGDGRTAQWSPAFRSQVRRRVTRRRDDGAGGRR
jgi:hypothetical protein